MRLIAASVVTALVLPPLPSPQIQKESVPFVGCPTSVQGDSSDGPHGAPVVVELDHATAQQLAFYKGDVGHGAFAPRGWHCGAWAGSATSTLLVLPGRIGLQSGERTLGPKVEVVTYDGETSGRVGVAIYASQLFPRIAAALIESEKNESLLTSEDFARGRSGSDSVWYGDSLTADFITPAHKTGLGAPDTPSPDTTRGVVILYTSGDLFSGLSILRVRLGSNRPQLTLAVLRLNAACIKHYPC